jgi:hypothetical protein
MPWRHIGEWRSRSVFHDLGIRWRWVVSFTPLGDRAPGTHWVGGWVGPGVGLDCVEKRKILRCRESNPGPQPVAIPTELSRLLKKFLILQYSPASCSVSVFCLFSLLKEMPIPLYYLPFASSLKFPSSLLGTNIFSVLCSQATSPQYSSSGSVRDEVSRPHKITGKIIVFLYIKIYFFRCTREDKMFWTEWWEVFLQFK